MISANCPSKRHIPGVSFPENGVTVSGHDLTGLEQAPDKLLHLFVGGIHANGFHNLDKCCISHHELQDVVIRLYIKSYINQAYQHSAYICTALIAILIEMRI